MEKQGHRKSKNKKAAPKPKTIRKRTSEGPTCSMFLHELSRKLALKKREQEESPKNIVQTIIDSVTNALPVKFSTKSPSKKESPTKIETLQTYAPELLPSDTIAITNPITCSDFDEKAPTISADSPTKVKGFKMPKMPLINSDVFKQPERVRVVTEDIAINTGAEHDVASEIAKHVGTLRKISLIAEEFNQKTAKNLKEIVDSVQGDLLKKLEELQAEQKALMPEKPLTIDYQNETF